MTLQEFVKQTAQNDRFVIRPQIICKDGFKMSVQGSEGHYCSPRETQDWYNEMEIGYPSAKEDDLLPFAEQDENPTETVYGYVPCEIIEKVIEKHGGIDEAETFKPNSGHG
jgi:hypothetical protein